MPAFHVYCNGRTEPFPINDAADSDAAIAAAREAGFMPQRDIRNFRTVKLDKVGGSEDGPRIVPTIPSQRAPRQRPAAVKPAPEPKTPKE